MTTLVLKPVVLDSDGVFGQLPTGSIINAGGVVGPTFIVDGRGLLFDDGSSTGVGGTGLTLQSIYDNTPAITNAATIVLTQGKNLLVKSEVPDGFFFSVSADDNQVIINGDLIVTGETTTIETVIQDVDHWVISPSTGATTALSINPDIGFTPIVDLVTVRRTFGSTPVFRIDSAGNLIASQNLTVGGLINGINVGTLDAQVAAVETQIQNHLDDVPGYRHEGSDIDIDPIANLPTIDNVQDALEALSIALNPQVGNVSGFYHLQTTPSTLWTISHGGNTSRVVVSVYDSDDEQIIPERVKIVNINSVEISFGQAMTGSAAVLLF